MSRRRRGADTRQTPAGDRVPAGARATTGATAHSAVPPAGRGEESPAELAHALAERVRQCPDVAGLAAGPFGTTATYLPGDKVSGVAVRPGEVEIAIIARYGRPLPQIAEQVRDAVAPLTGERRIDVAVEDVALPD